MQQKTRYARTMHSSRRRSSCYATRSRAEIASRRNLFYISKCDVLIVAGTSLNVYPAANLIHYYKGNKLILINLDETPFDFMADIVIHEKCGKVLNQIIKEIQG